MFVFGASLCTMVLILHNIVLTCVNYADPFNIISFVEVGETPGMQTVSTKLSLNSTIHN